MVDGCASLKVCLQIEERRVVTGAGAEGILEIAQVVLCHGPVLKRADGHLTDQEYEDNQDHEGKEEGDPPVAVSWAHLY